MSDIGGFGGLFDLKAAGYNDPILVAATDGVGTKLKIAIDMGRHNTVGIDLVAMCVNDLVVQGAEPLFFLDYFATAALNPEAAAEVVSGIAEGCKTAGCALLGGETAELPGLYASGDYDLAGFSVGAAERGGLLPKDGIASGDVVVGVASDGVHSNGFSLARKVVEVAGLNYRSPAPFKNGEALGDVLLTPTRIYVRSCLAALAGGNIKAFAHITGGGLLENIPRVLPEGLSVTLDAAAWSAPPVFGWLAQSGGIASEEMARTFNCGIGMIAVASADDADAVCQTLNGHGETATIIGQVGEAHDGHQVVINGLGEALNL